jgi:hypothetical protein
MKTVLWLHCFPDGTAKFGEALGKQAIRQSEVLAVSGRMRPKRRKIHVAPTRRRGSYDPHPLRRTAGDGALGVVSREGGPWHSLRGGEIDSRIKLPEVKPCASVARKGQLLAASGVARRGRVEQNDRAAARDSGPYGQVSRRFGHRQARRDRPHRRGGACRSTRHYQSLSGMPHQLRPKRIWLLRREALRRKS